MEKKNRYDTVHGVNPTAHTPLSKYYSVYLFVYRTAGRNFPLNGSLEKKKQPKTAVWHAAVPPFLPPNLATRSPFFFPRLTSIQLPMKSWCHGKSVTGPVKKKKKLEKKEKKKTRNYLPFGRRRRPYGRRLLGARAVNFQRFRSAFFSHRRKG